jgi:hypothetical protein
LSLGRPTIALTRLHLREWSTNRDLIVDLDKKLGNDPVGRRRHLGIDLVGRDLDHRVALVDEVPLGHVPLEHDALGDRLPHLGHLDLDGRRLRHLWIECMKER